MPSLRTSFHKVQVTRQRDVCQPGLPPYPCFFFFFLLRLQSTTNLNQATGLLVPRFAAMRFHVIALSLSLSGFSHMLVGRKIY